METNDKISGNPVRKNCQRHWQNVEPNKTRINMNSRNGNRDGSLKELLLRVNSKEKPTCSPYKGRDVWARVRLPYDLEMSSTEDLYEIPLCKKPILKNNLKVNETMTTAEIALATEIRSTIEQGPTEKNYKEFFRHLLWLEETSANLQLKKFNMHRVKLLPRLKKGIYKLYVPGLNDKQPSLIQGGKVLVVPDDGCNKIMYEGLIKEIKDDGSIGIHGFHKTIRQYCFASARFNVRFVQPRVTYERMHAAVDGVCSAHAARVHPKRVARITRVPPVTKFFNPLVEQNPEQRSAVEHILAKTSGLCPYMVLGPPGTGKTITIVEAILQVVTQNPDHRVLVCADSNMAADHIAKSLLKYRQHLHEYNFLIRVNSETRFMSLVRKKLPAELKKYYRCNVPNWALAEYKIVVSTLVHSAKYKNKYNKVNSGIWWLHTPSVVMSHVFVDEAAQALEPAALVPVAALLAPAGQLVLAGDPHQLGPVVASNTAASAGLGISLMERLRQDYPDLYATGDSQYITMLKENFRSHPNILKIPNALFYENELKYCAAADPLSEVDIMGNGKSGQAIVFHAVRSKCERVRNNPSFYNSKEIQVLEVYVKALLEHGVSGSDIGVVTPYKRQMIKATAMLRRICPKVMVGTVDAFQGQEKRVIIISTVRSKLKGFNDEAKFQLGFVKNEKRFNVAITRGKAKVIVIGNPCCLQTDPRCWGTYINECKELGSYFSIEQETRQKQIHKPKLQLIDEFALMRIKGGDDGKNSDEVDDDDNDDDCYDDNDGHDDNDEDDDDCNDDDNHDDDDDDDDDEALSLKSLTNLNIF